MAFTNVVYTRLTLHARATRSHSNTIAMYCCAPAGANSQSKTPPRKLPQNNYREIASEAVVFAAPKWALSEASTWDPGVARANGRPASWYWLNRFVVAMLPPAWT